MSRSHIIWASCSLLFIFQLLPTRSLERGSKRRSRGKGGARGSVARASHIFFMFTADFAAYFRGIFGIFGVLATFYDYLTVWNVRACAQISGVLLQVYACMSVCVCMCVCTANMRSIDEAGRQTGRQTDCRLGQLAKNKANFTFQLRIKQLSIQAVTPESMAGREKWWRGGGMVMESESAATDNLCCFEVRNNEQRRSP